MNAGIYIHIPFCRKKCDYCGFYSSDCETPETIELFIKRLKDEISIESAKYPALHIDSIFFGGGSPSMLTGDDIENILNMIFSHYSVTDNCEITIEVNPADVTAEKLARFTSAGINRMTLGVQTLDIQAYKEIGRSGGYCDENILETFFSQKGADVCADIIAGIPGQSPASYESGLMKLLGYHPVHLSVYLLSIEHSTPYALRCKNSETDEDNQIDSYNLTRKLLCDNGYVQYEISNYSFPGKESVHNLKYWQWGNWLGFGPSAHSCMNGERYSNEASLSRYLDNMPRIHDERNIWQKASEYIMTGLRLTEGFSINTFKTMFGSDISDEFIFQIERACAEGRLVKHMKNDNEFAAVSPGHVLLTDSITYDIIRNNLDRKK